MSDPEGNPHRTRRQVRNNPTVEEIKRKAFEERKKKWPEEDNEALEKLEAEGKTVEDSLLHTVESATEQEQDIARLFVKILETHDYERNFPVNSCHPLLHFLRLEFNGHCLKPWDPSAASLSMKDIPLKEARIQLLGRKSTVCCRLENLSTAITQVTMGLADWKTAMIHFKILAGDIWMDMMDTCLVCTFLHGEELKEELKTRKTFVKGTLLPVLDMVDVTMRDRQVLKPELFSDYDVNYANPEEEPLLLQNMTEAEVTQRREEMKEVKFGASVIEESQEVEPEPEKPQSENRPIFTATTISTPKPGLGLSKQLTTVEKPNFDITRVEGHTTPVADKNPVTIPATQRKREVAKEDGVNLTQAILNMEGVALPDKVKLMSLLNEPTQNRQEAMDTLTEQFHLRPETSTAAYGDATSVAQYNALPNVHLPPFYGNSLEFAKWWQMFIYLVDKNPKIPKIMKLNILTRSLQGTAEYLTHQVAFCPQSYDTLKENVKEAFDDSEGALKLLNERLKNWPTIRKNDYKHLAEFVGFASNYVMQLMSMEEGASFNPKTVIHELYSKFNPTMMHDYRREWRLEERDAGKQSDAQQVAWMLEWLKEQLKTARSFYNADPHRQPIKLGMPSGIATEFQKKDKKKNGSFGNQSNSAKQKSQKSSATTADNLHTQVTEGGDDVDVFQNTSFSGNGGGRGVRRNLNRGRGNFTRGGARGRSFGNTSTASKGNFNPGKPDGQNSSTQRTSEQKTGYEIFPCAFCNQQQHTARSCNQYMKPDTVYLKAMAAALCLNCLRMGHFASSCPHPGCGMEGCQAKHHKKMHGHNVTPSRKQ